MTNTADSTEALCGGCYCGHVRYEAAGDPFHATSCHCSICRRVSGAAFVTWFSIQRAEFTWVRGHAASFASTAKGTRTFCPLCSTPLTFQHADYPAEIDITLCSLDDPTALTPKDHTFVSNRLAWVQLADQLPEYWEVREEHR
jgi:hypothetical protein